MPAHRDAAQQLRDEIRYWQRLVAGWQMSADAWPRDRQVRKTLAWCQGRLDIVRDLPATFFLVRSNRWELRASQGARELAALMEKAGYQMLSLYGGLPTGDRSALADDLPGHHKKGLRA